MSRPLAALLLVGCGSSGTTAAPTRPSEFLSAQYRVSCDAIGRCCTQAQRDAHNWKGVDVCVATAVAGTDAAGLDARFTAGTLAFDAAAASTCLAAERASYADCAHLTRTAEPSCALVMTGVADVNQQCAAAAPYCAPGRYCDGQTCLQVGAAGDVCSPGSCGAGLGCSAGGTCAEQQQDGAACTLPEQCTGGLCPAGLCATPPAPSLCG